MKIAVEFDDFSGINHNLGLLEKLKEHFPKFKVTLFTVPWEVRFGRNLQESAPITLERFKPWCKAVAKSGDWMEIALHGLTHAPMEFAELSFEAAVKRLVVGMKMFENREFENFTKIFKAPQWEISDEAKRAAENMGFIVVENNYYDWNLAMDGPKPDSKEPYIVHGHIQNECENGLEETFHKIMKLSPDTEFLFLSEVLNAKKGDFNPYK
jgi:peptidoglycan/xylan/chitin deacetylase (PgdA/CDA1 family)